MQTHNIKTVKEFFKNLPKITNNHVHIFALFPYYKLIKIIMKIDPELYDKIYILTTTPKKYTVTLINDNVEGIPYKETTKREDWAKISTFDSSIQDNWIINEDTKNPSSVFENIQIMFRTFLRNYKIYYYLWYSSLYVNYRNNIFYLNVRGKPGNINKDVNFSQKLYINSSHAMPWEKFNSKIYEFTRGDKDISRNDFKYMYRQYTRIKMECDLIVKAVNDFNTKYTVPHFVDDEHLLEDNKNDKNDKNDILKFNTFDTNFDPNKKPQMMVQYIISIPKKSKNVEFDLRYYLLAIKMMLYIAIIINDEYSFQFFNGIDLIGNEQRTYDLSTFIPVITKLLYFRKYGINFIPHIGETNNMKKEISIMEKYIFDKNINRIGHGMSFITTKEVLEYIDRSNKIIFIESSPISNYLLGYYHPEKHPHLLAIKNPKIKLMICSDDNGIFNYSSVTLDYIYIYKYWKISLDDIKKLISNGIDVVYPKYKNYYFQVFYYLWSTKKIDDMKFEELNG